MSSKTIVCGVTGSLNSQKAVKATVETALKELERHAGVPVKVIR